MAKYYFKILLVILLASFSFWGRNDVLAASAPTNPASEITDVTYDYIAIDFSWDKNNESGIGYYRLVIKCLENCQDRSGAEVPQPSQPGRVSKNLVGGFSFSLPTKDAKYSWEVGACETQGAQEVCTYAPSQEFVTPLQPAPPGTGGNGGDGGNGGNGGGTPIDLPRPISAQNLDELFSAIIKFLFVLAFTIGPLMIVYAGFLLLTAAGDVRKLTLAKTIILWTLIALTIISLARGAPSIVKGLLGG